jgi:hypothetical protein
VLDAEDIERTTEGLRVMVRPAKTDQEGQVPSSPLCGDTACPVAAVRGWLDAANITAGPVFRPISKGRVGYRSVTVRQRRPRLLLHADQTQPS